MKHQFRVVVNQRTLLKQIALKNLAQNKIASDLGVSSTYLSQLINERRSPSPNLRRRMLEYFAGVKFDDLFTLRDGIG